MSVTYRLTGGAQWLGPGMDALRVWAGAPVNEGGQLLPRTEADEPGRGVSMDRDASA
ncbi:hypothetical protein [Streptomyces phaeochromogenes]|uniref:hypothetical protein n=1 Tax=Streptomyces phaeochromogenes TaxID=1923 RepID=UPI0012FF519D|nr:hypothetical protein [Streptomyces phaeochromogenes]